MLFFFNDTATTEIYTLSLHDALPISVSLTDLRADIERYCYHHMKQLLTRITRKFDTATIVVTGYFPIVTEDSDLRLLERSEEHTSELQSRQYLVCRLLLEKKKQQPTY